MGPSQSTRVVLEAIDELGPFDVLIGSSFGGLATANAAAQRPQADLRLVLLAPAFGYDELVASTLGQQAMEAWEQSGTHTFQPPDGTNLSSCRGPLLRSHEHIRGRRCTTQRPSFTGPGTMSCR